MFMQGITCNGAITVNVLCPRRLGLVTNVELRRIYNIENKADFFLLMEIHLKICSLNLQAQHFIFQKTTPIQSKKILLFYLQI